MNRKFIAFLMTAVLSTQTIGTTYAATISDKSFGLPTPTTTASALNVTTSAGLDIDPLTLLPVEVVRGTLNLSGLFPFELKNMPVETILSQITNWSGQPIDFGDEDLVLWSYLKDENGNKINDSYQVVNRDDVIDMSATSSYSGGYTMEILIGTGNQLDEFDCSSDESSTFFSLMRRAIKNTSVFVICFYSDFFLIRIVLKI